MIKVVDKTQVTRHTLSMNTELIKAWIQSHAPNGHTKLAAKIGVSAASVNYYINGKRNPSAVIAIRIARALGITAEELFKKSK